MKKLFPLVAGVSFFCLGVSLANAEISVIPQPATVKESHRKTYPFDASFFVFVNTDAGNNPGESAKTKQFENTAVNTIRRHTGLRLSVRKVYDNPYSAIRFKTNSADEKIIALGKEGYRLTITPASPGILASKSAGAADYTEVNIESSGEAGAFYGLQTLIRLFKNNGDGTWSLPAVEITDSPRFAWRGLMLDEARKMRRPRRRTRC